MSKTQKKRSTEAVLGQNIINLHTKKQTTMTRTIFLLILVSIFTPLAGRTIYATRFNDFEPLERHTTVDDGMLLEDNNSVEPLLNLDSTMIASGDRYRYYVRIANRHNRAGKGYRVTGIDGAVSKVVNPEWGIVFNYLDEGNYMKVTFRCDNSALHDDVLDRRTIMVKLSEVAAGIESAIDSATFEKGFSLEDDFNVVGIECDGSTVRVMGGKRELNELFSSPVRALEGVFRCGVYTGSGALTATERSVLWCDTLPVVRQSTGWSRSMLDDHFSQSSNPVEGYWTYLDRDIDDGWLKLGGKYTVALVDAGMGSYDIIYVDGAQVNPDGWQEGMLKGTLKKTIFTDVYTASWVDSMHEPLDDDVQASIESGVILTVKFPVYRSQVRFSKVIAK